MLAEYVTFIPLAGRDPMGDPTWGSPIGPVLAHVEGPISRMVSDRAESTTVPSRIWVDGPDFSISAVPSGSRVQVNGHDRVITSIDAMNHMASDPFDTGVHHWELSTT